MNQRVGTILILAQSACIFPFWSVFSLYFVPFALHFGPFGPFGPESDLLGLYFGPLSGFGLTVGFNCKKSRENTSLKHLLFEDMTRCVCRDCLIPGCGAKYLVRLANHLTDVLMLDIDQRKMHVQEAKLQPKVKCIAYKTKGANTSQQQDERDMVRELSRANRKNKLIGTANAEKRKNSN